MVFVGSFGNGNGGPMPFGRSTAKGFPRQAVLLARGPKPPIAGKFWAQGKKKPCPGPFWEMVVQENSNPASKRVPRRREPP